MVCIAAKIAAAAAHGIVRITTTTTVVAAPIIIIIVAIEMCISAVVGYEKNIQIWLNVQIEAATLIDDAFTIDLPVKNVTIGGDLRMATEQHTIRH